ncbi:MAG: class I SAM-dependent methyltransferase [Bacteroidota bacterium]
MSIKKAYNLWSDIYDTNENKTRDLDKIVTIEVLSKYKFDTVIELGCGTGKNTEFLASNAKEIIALDFSEKMLEKAKQKVRNNIVKFIKTDLKEDWYVENDYFDLVTCSLTLEHIKDLGDILNQVYLKLKSGGKFFISELHPFKQYTGSKAKYESEGGINELEVYTHHISDYLESAKRAGFNLLELNEWFDDDSKDLPRLISFVFEK